MERLQRRSDDIAETRSGLFAVAFKRHLKETSDLYSFSFHVKPAEPAIEIRWRKEDGIAVIDQHVAMILLNRGYARNITDEELLRWNHMVDQLHPDALSPAPVVIPAAPVPVAAEPAAEEGQSATEEAKEAVQQGEATQLANQQQTPPTGAPEGDEKPEEEKTQEEQEATGDNDQSQEDAGSSEGTSEEENSTEETDGETGDGSSEDETVETADEKPAKKTRAKKGLL